MTRLNESDIELFTIDVLKKLGYSWKWGPDIAPDSDAEGIVRLDEGW
jgi:type I restriction enzyme, R subunit